MQTTGSSTAQSPERRKQDRRKYNRRDAPESPPYFVMFERIAVALESIAREMGGGRTVVLPPDAKDTPGQ